MKKRTLFTILLLLTLVYGCLKNEELSPPTITLSQGENEILNFSTIQSADVNVHIESGEELKKFTVVTRPMSSWTDTIIVFDRFTHRADIEMNFRVWSSNFKVSKDSLYDVTYTAYTEDTSCTVKRKLRFRYVYPELDSFDLKMESAVMGKCLLDIENRCCYKYNEYTNHYYDLVYVCDMDPSEGAFGLALVSPDAPYLMRYFKRKLEALPYDPAKRRSTECGVISDAELDWRNFNSAMLGEEFNWVKQNVNPVNPADGSGVIGLNKNQLMKFRLDNGRFIMIKVLDRVYAQFSDKSVVTLRIYLQK